MVHARTCNTTTSASLDPLAMTRGADDDQLNMLPLGGGDDEDESLQLMEEPGPAEVAFT